MASMLDRGDSYRVQYLGSAMLAQVSTGLGVLQKPLRNLYFQFHQAKGQVKLQERNLMMTNKGMVMSYPGDQNGGRGGSGNAAPVEDFYVMPSILFWDAVQFVIVKDKDKRLKAAFEPLDNDHNRNKDNLFSVLDKPMHFLQGQRHPPIFTCVLRRTQGLKALDVHAFVCYSEDEALGLVRALKAVHINYQSGEQQQTGVFGYNPFGKENIRTTAGLQNDLSYVQQAGAIMGANAGQRQPVDNRNSQQFTRGSAQESQPRNNATPGSANVRDKHARAKSPARGNARELSRFTASQPNLSLLMSPMSVHESGSGSLQRTPSQATSQPSQPGDRNSRVFLLSQSDFKLEEKKPEISTPESPEVEHHDAAPKRRHSSKHSKSKETPAPTQGQTYEYLQHINRTLERPKDSSRPNEAISLAAAVTSPNAVKRASSTRNVPQHYASAERPVESRPAGNSASQAEFSSGGIFQEDVGSNSVRVNKNRMGQGYSLLSSSQGPPPGYAPHQSQRQPYAPSQTPVQQDEPRSPSPTYQSTIPRNKTPLQTGSATSSSLDRTSSSAPTPKNLNRNPSTAQAYENISKFVDNHKGNNPSKERTPSGYPAPVVPTRSPMLGSSRSFRQPGSSSPERRPTSTTQGTVMAQVTPQSQRSSNIGPFANRPGGQNWDKNTGGSTPNLRVNDATFVSQSSTHNKPVAMVPPHKIQGVKVLPNTPSLSKQDGLSPAPAMPLSGADQIMKPPRSSMAVYPDEPHKGQPVRRTQTQYSPESKGMSMYETTSPSGDIYALPRKNSQKSKQKLRQTKSSDSQSNWQFQNAPSQQQQGPREVNGREQNENLLVNQKKDAEIASALQNIQFDYEGTMSAHAPHRTNFEKSLGYFP